jgi:foldase protein PrsA
VNSRRVLCVALIGAAVAASACGRYGTEYAAVVDGHTITFDALEHASRSAAAASGLSSPTIDVERQTLLQLVSRILVADQLAKQGVVVTNAEVDRQIAGIESQYQSTDAFRQALQQSGLDLAGLADRVRDQLSAQKLEATVGTPPVTDGEVASAYNADIETYTQVHARHILFSTQARSDAQALALARSTLAALRGGADFAATAKRLSDDAGSKANGGDLGTTTASQYIPEFAKAVETAPIGVVTGPVKSQFGYHIILVVSRTVQPLSAVRDAIRSQLEQQRGQTALQAFFEKLVRTADIEINPRIGDLDLSTMSIVDHTFLVPPSPKASATPVPSSS